MCSLRLSRAEVLLLRESADSVANLGLSTPRTLPSMTAPAPPMPAPAVEPPVVLDDPLEQGRFTRWVTGPQRQRWAESSLQLAGLHCAACSGLIEQAVAGVAGVHSVRVSAAAERATVCWDPERTRPSLFIAAIRHAGYDAVPDAAAPARALRVRQQRQALWRLFVAGFCAMQVMMFATPSYVAAAGELSDEMRQLLNWGSWIVSLPVMVFSAGPYFSGAWQMLRRGRIGMDVPVALGIAITFIASSGATFAPGGVFGAEVYFDSLTMFVSFLLASRWLELRARQGAAETLERALARLPETAGRARSSQRGQRATAACGRPGPGAARVVFPRRWRAGSGHHPGRRGAGRCPRTC